MSSRNPTTGSTAIRFQRSSLRSRSSAIRELRRSAARLVRDLLECSPSSACWATRARSSAVLASWKKSRSSSVVKPALRRRFELGPRGRERVRADERSAAAIWSAPRVGASSPGMAQRAQRSSRIAAVAGGSAWLPWQASQPSNSPSSTSGACGLSPKSSFSRTWHLPHTAATVRKPGGTAPWLPWQVAHWGARERRPSSSSSPRARSRGRLAGISASSPCSPSIFASAWHLPHVAGTLVGWTGLSLLPGPRMPCAPWQSRTSRRPRRPSRNSALAMARRAVLRELVGAAARRGSCGSTSAWQSPHERPRSPPPPGSRGKPVPGAFAASFVCLRRVAAVAGHAVDAGPRVRQAASPPRRCPRGSARTSSFSARPRGARAARGRAALREHATARARRSLRRRSRPPAGRQGKGQRTRAIACTLWCVITAPRGLGARMPHAPPHTDGPRRSSMDRAVHGPHARERKYCAVAKLRVGASPGTRCASRPLRRSCNTRRSSEMRLALRSIPLLCVLAGLASCQGAPHAAREASPPARRWPSSSPSPGAASPARSTSRAPIAPSRSTAGSRV